MYLKKKHKNIFKTIQIGSYLNRAVLFLWPLASPCLRAGFDGGGLLRYVPWGYYNKMWGQRLCHCVQYISTNRRT